LSFGKDGVKGDSESIGSIVVLLLFEYDRKDRGDAEYIEDALCIDVPFECTEFAAPTGRRGMFIGAILLTGKGEFFGIAGKGDSIGFLVEEVLPESFLIGGGGGRALEKRDLGVLGRGESIFNISAAAPDLIVLNERFVIHSHCVQEENVKRMVIRGHPLEC